jgi:hypothetical protein
MQAICHPSLGEEEEALENWNSRPYTLSFSRVKESKVFPQTLDCLEIETIEASNKIRPENNTDVCAFLGALRGVLYATPYPAGNS